MTNKNDITGGEWRAIQVQHPQDARLIGFRVVTDLPEVSRNKPVVIADIQLRPDMPVAVNEANANVLAAAKDLLAALELLYDTGADSTMFDYARSKARAAIEKAMGKSPAISTAIG